MSFVMQISDQKKALGYLKQELGEDNPCYLDLKAVFSHRMLFTFGSIIASTVLLVSAVAFCRIKYGNVGSFVSFVFLFVFISINIACSAFEDNFDIGFWKWNRYYRLWLLYKKTAEKKIPLEILTDFSRHYSEKDAWKIKSYKN